MARGWNESRAHPASLSVDLPASETIHNFIHRMALIFRELWPIRIEKNLFRATFCILSVIMMLIFSDTKKYQLV